MKISRFILSLFICFFLIFQNVSFSQIHIDIDFGDIIACQENQVDVTITFPTSMSFPNHLYFAIEVDGTEIMSPTPSGNPAKFDLGTNFSPGASNAKLLSYSIRIPCDKIPTSYDPSLPPNTSNGISLYHGLSPLSNTTWYLTTPTGTPNQTAMNYQLLFPVFTFSSNTVPNNVDFITIHNGNTFERVISYTNSGPGELIGQISFNDATSCSFVQIKDIGIKYIDLNSNQVIILNTTSVNASSVNIPAMNCTIPSMATVIITENLQFPDYQNNCLFDCSGSHNARFTSELKWGCTGDLCFTDQRSADMNPGPLQPNLIFQRIDPVDCNSLGVWDNSNPGQTTTWKFRLINQGANIDVAKDVSIVVENRFPSTSLYYINDISNIKVRRASGPNINPSIPPTLLSTWFPLEKPMCLQQQLSAISIATYSIGTLYPGEELFIDLDISYCCSQLDDGTINTTGYSIFNEYKTLNSWHVDVKGFDECNEPIPVNTNNSDGNYPSGNYISQNGGITDKHLYLEQQYTPANDEFHSPCFQPTCCSQDKLVEISNIEFNVDHNSASGFRLNTSNIFSNSCATGTPSSMPVDATIRFVFELGAGLTLATTGGYSCPNPDIQFLNNLGDQWPCGTFHPVNTNCINGQFSTFTIDFHSSDLTNNSIQYFYEFLNSSRLQFSLKGCCCNLSNTNPTYTIKTYMAGIDGSCFVPMSEIHGEGHIHCPGCTWPGMSVAAGASTVLERTTFGYEDDLDDGKKDNNVLLSPGYIVGHPRVALNRSIVGDELKTVLKTIITPGNPGQQMSDLLLSGIDLSHLYAEIVIPFSNCSQFDVAVTKMDIELIRGGASFTASNISTANVNWNRLIYDRRSISVSTGLADLYFLDLSPAILSLFGLPGSHLQESDEFKITLYYVVKSNYNPNPNSYLVGDNEFLSRVQLNTYLTEVDLVTLGVFEAMSYPTPQTPYLIAQDQINTGHTPASPCNWLWVCETEGGNHYFTTLKTRLRSYIYEGTTTKCTKVLEIKSELMMGGESKNIFPFEYRQAPGIVKYEINFPGSYSDYFPHAAVYHGSNVRTYDDLGSCYPEFSHPCPMAANLSLTSNPGPNNYLLTYPVQEFEQMLNYLPAPPCTTAISTPVPAMLNGDEQFNHHMAFEFEWRKCNSGIITLNSGFINLELNLNSTNGACTTSSHLIIPDDPTANNILTPSSPDGFRLASLSPLNINQAFTDVDLIFWNDGLNEHDAENSFIYMPTNSDLTYELYQANNLIVPNGTTVINGIPVIYWEVGTIPYSSSNSTDFILRIGFINCPATSNFAQEINYGWNCYSYPNDNDIQSNNYCYLTQQNLNITFASSGQVFPDIPTKEFYQICDHEILTATFLNSGPEILDLELTLYITDPIFQSYLNTGSYVITCSNAQNQVTVNTVLNPPYYHFNVSLLNGHLGNGESLTFSIEYIPLANFPNTTPFEITLDYNNYCGASNQIGPVNWELHPSNINVCNLNVSISGPSLICENVPFVLTASTTGLNSGSPTTFEWSANGSVLSNHNPYNVASGINSTTIYTVTATNQLGDVATNTYEVQVINSALCCVPVGFNSTTDQNFSNELISNVIAQLQTNTLSTSSMILINGTLTVDQDFTFLSCDNIILGDGASINVISGNTLNIFDSDIRSCDKLARGIIAEPNSIVNIQSSNFNDCFYGIEARHNSTLFCEGGFFKNNYVGIYYSNEQSHSSPPFMVYGETNGTDFSYTAPLKPAYPGLTIPIYAKPFAGVMAADIASLSFGNNAKNENSFSNLNIGIYATRTNLAVNNCKFSNILSYNPYPSLNYSRGSGIYFNGTGGNYLLEVTGHNDPLNPEFTDCLRGISTLSASVTVDNSQFLNCDEGIRLINNRFQNISIKNNNIDFNRFGIVSLYNDAVITNEYTDNVLNGGIRPVGLTGAASRPFGVCINDGSTNTSSGNIRRNTINIQHRSSISNAIYLNGASNYYVNDNSIQLDYTGPKSIIGIGLQNSDANYLECNHIYGSRGGLINMDNPDMAMRFDRSSNYISCNDFTNTSTGIIFSDFCDNLNFPVVLRTNDIGNHFNGLRYTASATVAPQSNKGNTWALSVYPGMGAVNDDASGVFQEIFSVDGNTPINVFGKFNLPNPVTSGWFQGIAVSDENCDDNQTSHGLCGLPQPGGESPNDIFNRLIDIARDSINSADFNEETRWNASVALYELLINMPEYLDSSQVLADFYASNAGSVLQQIATLNDANDNFFNNQQTLLNLLDNNAKTIYHYSELIKQCDASWESDGINDIQRDSIINYRDALVDNTRILISFNTTGFHVIDSTLKEQADLLNGQNQNGGAEIYEQNEQAVNEAYFGSFSEGNVSEISNYAGALLSVAMQCPISGGPAVYRARSLYFYIDPDMTYNDEQECLLNGYIYRKGRSVFSSSRIYPNPAVDELTLVYNVSDQSTVEILDEVTRTVRRIHLDPNSSFINFSIGKLESGIYTYRIFNKSGEITDIGKFVVLK